LGLILAFDPQLCWAFGRVSIIILRLPLCRRVNLKIEHSRC